MNNLNQLLTQEGLASVKAHHAIIHLFSLIDKHYPVQEATTKPLLIRHYLKELSKELRGHSIENGFALP